MRSTLIKMSQPSPPGSRKIDLKLLISFRIIAKAWFMLMLSFVTSFGLSGCLIPATSGPAPGNLRPTFVPGAVQPPFGLIEVAPTLQPDGNTAYVPVEFRLSAEDGNLEDQLSVHFFTRNTGDQTRSDAGYELDLTATDPNNLYVRSSRTLSIQLCPGAVPPAGDRDLIAVVSDRRFELGDMGQYSTTGLISENYWIVRCAR